MSDSGEKKSNDQIKSKLVEKKEEETEAPANLSVKNGSGDLKEDSVKILDKEKAKPLWDTEVGDNMAKTVLLSVINGFTGEDIVAATVQDSEDEFDPSLASADEVEEAVAVLGACSTENCSYNEGYKRQALYSCLTCTPESGGEPAGICLACSLKCHADHELVEMYSKRNFRCDCGNSRFMGSACRIVPNKEVLNDNNVYNHNFWGRYCACDKTEDDVDESRSEFDNSQIQCVACEDWFHNACIKFPKSDAEDERYANMICPKCSEGKNWLRVYESAIAASYDASEGDSEAWWAINVLGGGDNSSAQACILPRLRELFPKESWQERIEKNLPTVFNDLKLRRLICKCKICKEMYKSDGMEFLLDEQDTIAAYSEKGIDKAEKNVARLESMTGAEVIKEICDKEGFNHSQRMYVAQGYSDLKRAYEEVFHRAQANDGVVTKEDVTAVFGEAQKRLKRRRGMPPDDCR